jgi:LysM repeat protein
MSASRGCMGWSWKSENKNMEDNAAATGGQLMVKRVFLILGLALLLLSVAGLILAATQFPDRVSVSKEESLPAPRYHIVRAGETLNSIGRFYGVNPWVIASANHLSNLNYVYYGMAVYIPYQSMVAKSLGPWTMLVNRADAIRVSLVPATNSSYTPTVEIVRPTDISATPPPVQEPGSTPAEPATPEYRVCPYVDVPQDALVVTAVTTVCQSLEQPALTWDWIITPTQPGMQIMRVYYLFVETYPSGEVLESSLSLQSQIEVFVATTSQFGAIIFGNSLLGVVLAVPWLWDKAKSKQVRLRLDAAVPSQVFIGRTFELAVALRQLSTSVLAEDDLTQVKSGDVQVAWPKSEQCIYLRVQITAPECQIHGEDHFSFCLHAGQDSPVFCFQLTPQKVGRIGIVVRAYQENYSLGSARIHTVALERVAGSVEIRTASREINTQLESNQRSLRRVLCDHFDLEEMHTLCDDLGVDFDDLRGDGKAVKARELVAYLERRSQLDQLIIAIRRERGSII